MESTLAGAAPDMASTVHSTVDPSARPMHAAGTVHSEVLDELVLLPAGASSAVALNESARAVWELCDGEHRVDEICGELAQAAGLSPEAICGDVVSAIAAFRRLGLLRP